MSFNLNEVGALCFNIITIYSYLSVTYKILNLCVIHYLPFAVNATLFWELPLTDMSESIFTPVFVPYTSPQFF
jgi:hypothetical protein